MLSVLAAVSLALVPGPAVAAQESGKVRVDRLHGVRFELAGRVLTVRLAPRKDRQPPDVRGKVWGKRIDAICSTVFHPRRRGTTVRQIRLWPRAELEQRYRFGRDIVRRVKWCLLEDGSADVAVVSFVPSIRVFGDDAEDKRTGRQVRRHLMREAPSATWLPHVGSISVSDGLIAVSTDLTLNSCGRRVARRICGLIRSYGVPDPSAGGTQHMVLGRDDVTLRACAARSP
jgi:hypothetical protein